VPILLKVEAMKDIPKVEIIWLDAGLENSNMPIKEAKELTPMTRKNVGYLLKNNIVAVRLAFGWIIDKDKHCEVCSDVLVIPSGCVVDIVPLSDGAKA